MQIILHYKLAITLFLNSEASVMFIINNWQAEQKHQSMWQGTPILYCKIILAPATNLLFSVKSAG